MPPARARVLDDSRSEASSTMPNVKEKSLLSIATMAGVTKPKKNSGQNSASAVKAGVAATAADPDPNLPKVHSLSTRLLISARYQHRSGLQHRIMSLTCIAD